MIRKQSNFEFFCFKYNQLKKCCVEHSLPFGKTQTYRYMIYNGMNRANYKYDIIEIVIKTNQGDWTVKP